MSCTHPISYNLQIVRGDDKVYSIQFKDDLENPIDITGWTVFFTVKREFKDTDTNALIKKTITTHTDALNGITEIKLIPTDTNWVGNFYFDIQVKKVDNSIHTVMIGTVEFIKDVTNRTS